MAATSATAAPPLPAAPSGPPRYRATRNSDGTWNVYDVPIFTAYDDATRRPEQISETWLSRALSRARSREAEGYLPPLHVQHTFRPDGTLADDVRPAGQFRLRRVGRVIYEGRPLQAVFADLLRMPPEEYEEVKKGKLPYRSVEVHQPHWAEETAEIDSLALMASEVPFRRLPLLRVAESGPTDRAEEAATAFYNAARPVRAVRSTSTAGISGLFRALVRFRPDEPTTTHMEARPTMADQNKPAEETAEKKEGEISQAADSATPGAAPTESSRLDKIERMMTALYTHLGMASSGDGEAPAEHEAAYADGLPPKDKGVPPVPPVAAARSQIGEAALAGQFRGLTARVDALEAEKKTAALVAKAKKDVAGYALGDPEKLDAEIARFAAQGPAALESFVAGVQRSAPARTKTAGANGPAGSTGSAEKPDAPEVAAYGSFGPEALATARALASQREKLPAAWRGNSMNLAQYLAIQPGLRDIRAAAAQ